MLLGKRPRPPMRRTTSMTGFAPDLVLEEVTQPSGQENLAHQQRPDGRHVEPAPASAFSPRGVGRRNSGEFTALETAAFLKSCGLCKRRLAPGRDIFIYRGEIAFCSLECRQQQINQDERKEKCSMTSMASKNKDAIPATAIGSEASGAGETVAAA